MLLPKTIPEDGIQTLSDVRYDPKRVDSLYAREVIDLGPLVEEENPARSMPTLPRPMLPSRVAMIGNYLPRKCGIATFTTDLCDAIHAEYRATELLALPVNDTEEGYSYPARVRFELSQDTLASYRQAADFLNFGNIDLVCLQHEYGIFGGPAGSHILELLRRLQMPVVTTLHTVLREPNADQRMVMEQIAALSDRLIVMSRQSADILQEVFQVSADKIDLIPHGIPDLHFTDPNFYKDAFGTEGKDVLLTFGLLSPNKGLENVIQALPSILSRHRNAVYMISGVTHPHVLRHEGDKYRSYLQKRAYLYARDMVWDRVAQQYMGSFERVYNERLRNPRATFSARNTEKTLDQLPAIKLDHLHRMTDDTGIVEHAVFVVPNYPEGYTTDDNARALIVAVLLEEFGSGAPAGALDLASRYLAFLWLAFDPTSRRFRNLLSYERQWQEPEGSEDSHGRALWGLGAVLGRSKDAGLRGAAGRLFELAIPAAVEFKSPRACSFALLGLQEYLDSFPGDRAALGAADELANRLLNSYRAGHSTGWNWFEYGLAYSNARLPQALIRAGMRGGNDEMISAG